MTKENQKKSSKELSSLRVVAVSFLVSVSDVLLNLVVALVTGSTVILSQSLQGLSDLVTASVLLVGVRRSRRHADEEFQFGYGREIFFYVLLAGMFMFAGTGVLSVYFGIEQVREQQLISQGSLAIGMMVFGLVTNFYAFRQSYRRLKQSWANGSFLKFLVRSSMLETKATFIIDLMGTIAALFGLLSLVLYAVTKNAQFDGIGSILIGATMMVSALLLMFDAKNLIVGRAVSSEISQKIKDAAERHEFVKSVLDLRTMFIGSAKLLVITEVHLKDGLTTDQVEQTSDEIKELIKKEVPYVHRVQVEAETPEKELSS